MFNFLKKFRSKLSHNLNFFLIKNLGSRVKNYKYLGFNAGWLLGKIKNSYLSIHLRPKKSENVSFSVIQDKDDFKVGIILQGPIVVNGDNGEFVCETIKIYKKIFSNCEIVLSTWRLSKDIYKKFNQLGIKIIQNEEPNDKNFGTVRNIDRQILTTHSALKYLNEKKISYSLKTRTDWRIYKPEAHYYLKNMIDIFPPDNDLMRGRIIFTSMITCKFKIYGIADTLQFGFTEDLLKFWDNEYFLNGIKRLSLGNYPSIINHTPIISDVFLCARYLSKINHELLWTLDDWWNVLSKYFCVVDTDSLDLLWTKYEDWFYEKRYYRSYENDYPRTVEFLDWINLYNDKKITRYWKKSGYQEKWSLNNGRLKLENFY